MDPKKYFTGNSPPLSLLSGNTFRPSPLSEITRKSLNTIQVHNKSDPSNNLPSNLALDVQGYTLSCNRTSFSAVGGKRHQEINIVVSKPIPSSRRYGQENDAEGDRYNNQSFKNFFDDDLPGSDTSRGVFKPQGFHSHFGNRDGSESPAPITANTTNNYIRLDGKILETH
jgi:hypothetical protein